MSTGINTNGFGPDITVDGHPLKSRQSGQLLLASVHEATITAGPGGRPVTDWSHIADQVDPTEVTEGDFILQGAGMFAVVTRGPRTWRRNFTRVETFCNRPGDLPQRQVHDFRVTAGAVAWRLRTA